MHFAQKGNLKVPTVVLDRRLSDWDGDSVYCDSIAGAQALTQHLLNLGHTRIAIISGPITTSTAEDRVTGYCLALYKAGLPVDQRLIWRGEYRASSGRSMTRSLLESDLAPTAILATNNAIAAGVLEELKSQGKIVPQDIAVVCFDEIPEMERFFPFLTSATQPAYDMGVNATQLLLSRIGASGPLRSRQVVLPTRLILRYSCGRFLKSGKPESDVNFTLLQDISSNQLIKPLDDSDRDLLLACMPGYADASKQVESDQGAARSDRERLIKTFLFEKTERFAILDGRGAGKRVIEYVLGRIPGYAPDGINFLAEDAVQFALLTGIDAVPCEISWRPGAVSPNTSEELPSLTRRSFPPPALASQLSTLENLLIAAEGSGVGVYARFSSFFENALPPLQNGQPAPGLHGNTLLDGRFEKLMDMLAKQQERVMRALCDRFGRDLCFISVQDDILTSPRFMGEDGFFEDLILPRLKNMLTPAKEHKLPVALDTTSINEQALPGLIGIGVNAIQCSHKNIDTLERLARKWQSRLAFITNLPIPFAANTPRAELENQISELCKRLSGQSGLAFSLDARDFEGDDFPPQYFLTVLRAIQRHRRT
jgi:hypothetical protein